MTPNKAASVRARLANLTKSTNRPFQEVLQHYSLERFLYRLARSPYSRRFLLKGALLLKAWGAADSRPTRDIDLLGEVENEIEIVAATAWLAVWIGRVQQQQIDYLKAENHALKEALGDRTIRLSYADRRKLAVLRTRSR